MELEVHRQLPYDVDIEQALLGVVLVDNHALDSASRVLHPEHFYDPLHQRLFAAMERMWASGHIVSPLTLKAAMEQDPGLAEVGGQSYLLNLARAALRDRVRSRVRREVPVPDVPRRVQVLHVVHAEDVRRQALSGALRRPRRDGGADAGVR